MAPRIDFKQETLILALVESQSASDVKYGAGSLETEWLRLRDGNCGRQRLPVYDWD